MYIPSAFDIQDPVKIGDIISSNSFATLVSQDGDSIFVSHLPFIHKPGEGAKGKLISHMAKANRHWKLFQEGKEALVIFNGPHAYISPNWYVAEIAVPTWNYANVHVYGIPKIMETDAELTALLDETVQKHEAGRPNPWTLNMPEDMEARLHMAIVGFEIEITRIEAKFKLGQNRSKEDQIKMIQTLKSSGDPESIRLASLMESDFQDA